MNRTVRDILIIFLLAAAVRAVYLAEMHDSPVFEIPIIDEEAYDQQAMQMVQSGNWIGTKVFYQDPLYPYFLGVLFKLFGHHLFVPRVIQALIGCLNCIVIYWLARELFDSRVALIAGLIAALYRTFFFQETLILKSSLVLVTISATLLLLLLARRRQHGLLWLAAGMTLGVGVLVRGNYLLFVPVAAVWAFGVGWRSSRRKAFACAGLFVAGAAAPIVPVTVRNYVVSGDFVLTTFQAGTNFYIGNHAGNLTGTLVPPPFVNAIPAYEDEDFRLEAERLTGRTGLKPSEISRFWFRKGLESIVRYPGLFAYRTWQKLRYATTNYEPPDNQSLYFARRFFSWTLCVVPVGFGLIFPFAVIGLIVSPRQQRATVLLHIFLATYLVSLFAFYVFARSRLPLVPPLIVLAAYAVIYLKDRFRELRSTQWALLGISFVAAQGWVWWPAAPVDLAHGWQNLGSSYAIRGRWTEAEQAYRRAVQIDPGNSMGYYGLGMCTKNKGELRPAEAYFLKAIELNKSNWQARAELGGVLNSQRRFGEAEQQLLESLRLYPYSVFAQTELGQVYRRQGRFADSIKAFEQALRLDPNYAPAHGDLGLVYLQLGERQKALEHLRRAVELAPDDPAADPVRQQIRDLGG